MTPRQRARRAFLEMPDVPSEDDFMEIVTAAVQAERNAGDQRREDVQAALQAALKDLAKANSALTSEQIAHGKTMRRFGAGTFSAGAGEPVVDELSRVEQFHEFLQGRLPDGVEVGHLPKLSADEAFTVIWFLQEVSEIISSSIEMCSYCGTLFDSDADGHIGEAGNYCSAMCEANDEREGIANEIESDHD